MDAKHLIRRPEIGCKLNKLADRTNLKCKWLIIPSFFITRLVTWIFIYTNWPNIYLDTFNALLWMNDLIIFNKAISFAYFKIIYI